MPDPSPTPPLVLSESALSSLAREMEEGIAPVNQLSAAQQAKVTAIDHAVSVLNEAAIPYTLFACPDDPSTGMKTIESHRLSYAPDLETMGKETPLSRQAILWAALRTLSIGLKGALAVIGIDGTPLYLFDNGRAMGLNADAKGTPKPTL